VAALDDRPASAVDGRVIGIDLGGTKTRFALAHDGVIEADLVVPTAQWRSGDLGPDAVSMAGLIEQQWGPAALHFPVGLGAHGCDSTEQCLTMERELSAHLSGPVRVVNDAELMPLAMGVSDGIGLVAGTGSIAVARDSQGRLITAGGWGWVLGDEGSAAGIVREAIRVVLAELDFGRRSDPLVADLLTAFGVDDGPGLAMTVTRSSSADYWGSHARSVFTAADEGSTLAREVLERAGEQLAGLIPRLRARGVTSRELVAGGGVLVAQPRLREAFLAVLAAGSPDVRVRILDTPPVVGAVALATSLTGSSPRTVSSTPEVT
jgi:glucosamine kinase